MSSLITFYFLSLPILQIVSILLAIFVSKQSEQADVPLKDLPTWTISLLYRFFLGLGCGSRYRLRKKWHWSKIKLIERVNDSSRTKFKHSSHLIYIRSSWCRYFVVLCLADLKNKHDNHGCMAIWGSHDHMFGLLQLLSTRQGLFFNRRLNLKTKTGFCFKTP